MHLALFAVQLAFASLAVAGKIVVRTLDPGALALVRLAGAAAVFGVLAALRHDSRTRPIPVRDVLAIAGCACLGIFGNQVLFLFGLQRTSAVNAAVLVATIPIFTVLVAILLRREAPRAASLLGVVIAFTGVLWLLGGAAELGGAGAVGDLLVVLNAIAYAFYLVLVRALVTRHGSVRVVAIGFFVGAVLAVPVGAPSLLAQAPTLSGATWALVIYVVLVPTVFTYLANAWALRFATSSMVAIYIYVQPIVAAVLAWLFLGERVSSRVVATAALVFAGIWLVTRRPPPVPLAPVDVPPPPRP